MFANHRPSSLTEDASRPPRPGSGISSGMWSSASAGRSKICFGFGFLWKYCYSAGKLLLQASKMSSSIFLQQGAYEMKKGRYERAVVSFTRVIDDDSSLETPYILRSRCLTM